MTSLVETLMPTGEEIILQEVSNSASLDHTIHSQDEMSDDDNTETHE